MNFSHIQLNGKTVALFQGKGELIVHKTFEEHLREENDELRRKLLLSEKKNLELERENTALKKNRVENASHDMKKIKQLLDESNDEYDVPDLVYAIRLWLYIKEFKNNKNDSYTNIANQWIKNNTPYAGTKDDKSSKRLRNIVSIFSKWHPSRQKTFNDGMKKFYS